MILLTASGLGALLLLSFTNSIPIIIPVPRTSPTIPYFSLKSLNFAKHLLDSCIALSGRLSLSMISSTFSPAAHANGLPPYVPPIIPGVTPSNISALAVTADSGMPAAIDLAVAMISGSHPASFQ